VTTGTSLASFVAIFPLPKSGIEQFGADISEIRSTDVHCEQTEHVWSQLSACFQTLCGVQ
jgi:hypothetical protein